jgi:hypothetical protein
MDVTGGRRFVLLSFLFGDPGNDHHRAQ